ncbi:hypothetical protein C8J57DRAFT_1518048 [Mycena rebaudengoi]|nr:hypothetical protein C8J57DRAFT_1518048 [Mycena rebaudengoi]
MFPNGVRPAYVVPDAVVIDAPLLRAVRIATRTWRINFDLPWSQLTSLVIDLGMRIGECMDLLPKCPALVKLEVYTEPDLSNNSPARTHPHLTLSALESLSVNSKPPSVLQFLTLPRLRVLNLTGDHDHGSPYVLTSLIQRSSCTPQQLTFYLPTTRAQYFPGLLLAVPHSVARLELQLGSSEHVHQLVADLSTPIILPALNTLCIRSIELLPTHLTALTDMLHARRIAPSSLDSFDVQLNVSVGWKPPPAVLAALQIRNQYRD